MSTPRTIAQVVTPQVVMEGAGVRLRRSIGGHELDHLDPFLLFDDFSSDNPADFVAGFPWHPHRGIETVTYILAGEVDHRDSIGNAGSIAAGECQWMTAGGGIMHEEMPRVGPAGAPRGAGAHGRLAGFQLWVNLPARLKLCAPRYQNIAAAEVPTVEPAPGVRVRVVAGQAAGATGPVRDIAAEPTYMDVLLEPGAVFTQPVPRGQAAFVYVFEGSGVFGGDPAAGAGGRSEGEGISAPRLVVLGAGDTFTAGAGRQPVRYLLVAGRPLDEPIARYGPFVMNTRAEIEQALRDLREGTFVYGSKR